MFGGEILNSGRIQKKDAAGNEEMEKLQDDLKKHQ